MVNNLKLEVPQHSYFSPKADLLLAQILIRKWFFHLKKQRIKPPFHFQRTQGSLISPNSEGAVAREALFVHEIYLVARKLQTLSEKKQILQRSTYKNSVS